MRSQDTKVNNVGLFGSVGKAGCLGLLALGLALVNPVSGFAFAEEDSEEAGVPVAQASEPVPSSVQIAFGEPVGTSSLTPISADGASALYSVRAMVDVANSGGYTVYLGSGKSELTGKNSGVTINSVTSSSSYEDLPVNAWGYSYAEGETAGTTFSAMPANVRGATLGGNNSANIKNDSKTFTLSFAAHIGNDKPADTYENEVTMSVVSSPLEIVNDFGIATMQEMTETVCSTATDNDNDGQISAQLEDIRDGKYYWVAKLADNKCWMTQNLDLDLSTSIALTPEDSDVASNWTPGFNMATTATADTVNANSQVETRSWSLGDYRITNPTVSSDCGYPKNDLSQCTKQFTAYDTPTTANGDVDAHYIVGNFYQWNAATAGTGGTITSGQAKSSICPKGWKLPESNVTTAGSFGGLMNAYSITKNVAGMTQLTGVPLYFVRGGVVSQATSSLFDHAGDYGLYWSSSPYPTNSTAYRLRFNDSTNINASDYSIRQDGYSVRCVAR